MGPKKENFDLKMQNLGIKNRLLRLKMGNLGPGRENLAPTWKVWVQKGKFESKKRRNLG